MASPRTLTDLFFGALDRFGQKPIAMRSFVDGAWRTLSYQDLLERVHALSAGLLDAGLVPGDRVAILAENRPEWAMVDYATLAMRGIDVPIYPTIPAKQVEYILHDSAAAAIFVSTPAQLAKVLEIRDRLPALKHIIAFDADATGPGVTPFDALLARGRGARDRFPSWRADALAAQPDDVATLIYTSGTTGDPKGVMLTHGNITSNVVGGLKALPLEETDECLSFLPLSHIFERMAGHYCMMHSGAIINYAVSVDTVAQDMVTLKPTVVLSVPRLYEKIYARVLENALSGSAVKRHIFFWAKQAGELWAEYVLAKKPVPRGLAIKKAIAQKLVFSKLQARTGGRLRFFVSGGAPLAPDIAKFFFAAGLPILEGYGLTETSPVITVNSFNAVKIGTVGRAIGGVEVKIAADGEILTRGPHVMKGYYNMPDATREAIDPDGWFHTGDIGVIDAGGFLRITDRKKDIIVTAGGKNIAPQPIENQVRGSKFVSNAVMLGDRRKFTILLLVPNMDNLKAWATHKGLSYANDDALLALPEVYAKLEREVGIRLKDLAHFEMPKRLLLLSRDFSIENGELTPTLKVKRRIVEKRYQPQIDALYRQAEGAGAA